MKWRELTENLYELRRFGIKPGLDRMHRALAGEGHPEEAYRVITVAGTNGKGTVASLIAAMLQGNGLRVGLYTSPHLIDLQERFRIDGRPVERESAQPVLRRLFGEYARGEASEGDGLTFFEFTTLSATVLFAEYKVDVGVFEVGLGGRLDAVNALEPAVAAVTTIGRDHTEYLGEEFAEIAGEKAGIFRAGVPAVVGVQEHEPARRALLESARTLGADVIECREADHGAGPADVVARHQQTARRVVEALACESITKEGCRQGLRRWRWPGRYDELAMGTKQHILIDAAHNRAGLSALRARIADQRPEIGAVIWASMKDKEPGNMKDFFEGLNIPVWGSLVANERARQARELEAFVPKSLWRGAASTSEVLEDVRQETEANVLVFGSVYLVGEVFEELGWTAESLVTYRGE